MLWHQQLGYAVPQPEPLRMEIRSICVCVAQCVCVCQGSDSGVWRNNILYSTGNTLSIVMDNFPSCISITVCRLHQFEPTGDVDDDTFLSHLVGDE